jgi:hypothetical protein
MNASAVASRELPLVWLIPGASALSSALRSVTVAAACRRFAKAQHRAATVTERRACSGRLFRGRGTSAVTGRTSTRRDRRFGCECYSNRSQALARAQASELGFRGRWQCSEARAQARACPMTAGSRPLFVHGNASLTGTSLSGHGTSAVARRRLPLVSLMPGALALSSALRSITVAAPFRKFAKAPHRAGPWPLVCSALANLGFRSGSASRPASRTEVRPRVETCPTPPARSAGESLR